MSMTTHSAHPGRGTFGVSVTNAAERLFDTLSTWHQRLATRHELASLDDRMLRDIGLSAVDVEHEVAKPFWRA